MKPAMRIGAALLACMAFVAASVFAIEAPDRKPATPKPAVKAPADEPVQTSTPESAPQTPAPAPRESSPEAGAPPEQTPPASPPAAKPADGAKAPATNQPAAATADGKPATTDDPVDPEDAKAAAQAPKRFIPTTKSTADNSATFPVDI